jgi:Protein of unknown function (DUF3891)
MIVRKEANGEQLLVGQTDHSRLAGYFASHWGNGVFAIPDPFESVVRAATFHDYGYLRYESAPVFNPETGGTPNFRDVLTDANRLSEYQWCFDWFLGPDPYASTLASMHRTGLWRGRYDALFHPPHNILQQKPEVDEFVAKYEAQHAKIIPERGWDPQQMRTNYRLLQVWDLLSLYFSCESPIDEYIEPVPTSYRDADGEGVRMTIAPVGATTIAVDPYPFDVDPLRIQLTSRRMKQVTFADHDAFIKAFFQAPLEVLQFELVDGAQLNGEARQHQPERLTLPS